jgi:hypothetical protein
MRLVSGMQGLVTNTAGADVGVIPQASSCSIYSLIALNKPLTSVTAARALGSGDLSQHWVALQQRPSLAVSRRATIQSQSFRYNPLSEIKLVAQTPSFAHLGWPIQPTAVQLSCAD